MNNRLSILLIDADHELSQILGAFLNFLGYRVNYTCRVKEAIKKIDLQRYSCILIDPDLLEECGEDVIRAASAIGSLNAKTPIVIMSGPTTYQLPINVVPSIKTVLPKPFTFEDLIGVLNASIEPSTHKQAGLS